MDKTKSKPLIFAYGFDKAGFKPPAEAETSKCLIHFFNFQTKQNLEEADGIIIPSGIFEYVTPGNAYAGISNGLDCDKDHLAKREKQMFQCYNRGGWIAFLLQEIENGDGKWSGTDLSKRLLNTFFENVRTCDPNPHIKCKADEFSEYMHDFGISRTMFSTRSDEHKPTILATNIDGIPVAAELLKQFFFLPLPSIDKSTASLISLVTKTTDAILEYKRRNDLHLPSWVEEIEFQSETRLRDDVRKFEEEIIQRREELSKWRRYKAILSTSGDTLNRLVVEILRDYFNLNLHSKEEFVEDAIIYDGEKPLFVVEIKGVKGGLKREYVNQVDSHRERLSLSTAVPGLLIINDFSDIDALAERTAKSFDALQVGHAEKNNIRVLRTTTLLEIIRSLETKGKRGEKLIELCLKGNPMVEMTGE